jgi:hypothetical protein
MPFVVYPFGCQCFLVGVDADGDFASLHEHCFLVQVHVLSSDADLHPLSYNNHDRPHNAQFEIIALLPQQCQELAGGLSLYEGEGICDL